MNRLLVCSSALLFAAAGVLACGPAKEPQAPATAIAPSPPPASSAAPATDIVGYHQPTWGDSSGKDGKGGTAVVVNDQGRLPLVAAGFDGKLRGDAVTRERTDWLLFHGDGPSLGLRWRWVTTKDDKFFGRMWGGGGVAFNSSWGAIDARDARYLVLWVKASEPGVDLEARLHAALKTKGLEDTGTLSLARHVAGGRLDTTWKRAVIPMASFPDVARVELKVLQQVMFTVKPGQLENTTVTVSVDDVYLTTADLVTPVSNLGYLVTAGGLVLEWDKDPAEKIQRFEVSSGGRVLGTAPAEARSITLPFAALGPEPVELAVKTIGASESSEAATLRPRLARPEPLTATVTLGKPAHAISPHIFGTNFGSPAMLKETGATGNRWGGNRTTKYNWKEDIDSAGSDWFFLNDYGAEPGTPENQKAYYRFIDDTRHAGALVNFTIPITPLIAKKHPEKGQRYCSFPTKLYPDQERTDGQGCGNGVGRNGKPIRGNDPKLGMTDNSPELQRDFVKKLVELFGPAGRSGVAFYSLDNEPGLWMYTHRDTMPHGISAEELVRRNLEYAAAVKAADPTAKVIGFASWGPKELAGSNLDYFKAGAQNPWDLPEEPSMQEVKAHGGDSQLVYFLKEAKKAEAKAGKRLIDVIDIHWYPELYANDSHGQKQRSLNDLPYDPVFTPLQFEGLREWGDPAFVPKPPLESWTFDADPSKDRLWRPYHPVIPALKRLIEANYPGTRLAINEYDTGSPEHYHGALLRAAALGMFAEQDLFMAQNWHQTGSDTFTYFAQKLYGNYDGKGGRFAGSFVPARSDAADLYAFAARRGAVTTLVIVNKNHERPLDVSLTLPPGARSVRTFTLAESLGPRLLEQAAKPEKGKVTVAVPAFAAVLAELS